jgi:nitrite reductase/ring-hydroxylating ferredoxin subunit
MDIVWHPLIAEADFPAEGKATGRLGGWFVLVARTEQGLFAVNDRCTHQAALISAGRIRRGAVMCPLHGARFEIASGRCVGGAYRDLRTFAVRVTNGMIEVAVPSEPPGMEDLPVAV